jgi:hypothetical protein
MQRHGTTTIAIAIAMMASSCTSEDDRVDDGAGTTSPHTSGETPTTITTTNVTTTGAPADGTTLGPATTLGDTADAGTTDATRDTEMSSTTADDTTGDGTWGTLPHEESFDGPDGAAWPQPWIASGTAVISAQLDGNRGRLVGQTHRVARMVLPGFEVVDADLTITVEFDDWTQQGFGLYMRQNGGALEETDPPGQGYAAYVEGGYMQTIGVWRELDGVEEMLEGVPVPGGALEGGVPYRLRLRVRQEGPHTRLRARIWPEGASEPATWQVDMIDDTPELQGTPGSFALDVYNYVGTGGVLVDDLRIEPI